MAFLDRFRRKQEDERAALAWNLSGTPPWHGQDPSLGGLGPNPLASNRPKVEGDLRSIVAAAQPNSVLSAAVYTRQLVLSQLWPEYEDNNTGRRFRHRDLEIFEQPGKHTTLPRLWMEAENSTSFAGNTYVYHDDRRDRLRVPRADWVSLIIGSDTDPKVVEEAQNTEPEHRRDAVEHALDGELLAYAYLPPNSSAPAQIIPEEFIAHWVAEPHPLSYWIGGSWITGCIRELAAEEQADTYADKFFSQGATPRLVYKMDPKLKEEEAKIFKKLNEEQVAGAYNSHRTLYVGGATDVKVVGTAIGDIALKDFRATLENRVAARSKVPGQILSIGSGNEGSSLNAGNYDSARKMFADIFFEPYADGFMAALASLAPGPRNARLTWDKKRVLLLQQDLLDAAEVTMKKASAIRQMIDGGFNPDEAVASVVAGNLLGLVGNHSGKFSVQLLAQPDQQINPDANDEAVAIPAGEDEDKETADV